MAKRMVAKDDKMDPAWFCATAKLAMKRGVSLIFGKDGKVYGMVPNTGGSVVVAFDRDDAGREFVAGVLQKFPDGAVFPDGNVFGGSAATKALRPYANVKLPESGGTAWIDAATFALHVKGAGVSIHSSSFGSNTFPTPNLGDDVSAVDFGDSVGKESAKLLASCTKRDAGRPELGRVHKARLGGADSLLAFTGSQIVWHACAGLPDRFSFDPSMMSLHDIAAYGVSPAGAGSATQRTFRLNDGTTVREGFHDPDLTRCEAFVSAALAGDKDILLRSDAVKDLVGRITELGLGSDDSFGGMLVFESSKTVMLSRGEPVAEFDVIGDVPPGEVVRAFFTTLSKAAQVGGDLFVCGEQKLLHCSNGQMGYIAGPPVTK